MTIAVFSKIDLHPIIVVLKLVSKQTMTDFITVIKINSMKELSK